MATPQAGANDDTNDDPDATNTLAGLMGRIDQVELFASSFAYVRSRTQRERVRISDVLTYLFQEESKVERFHLGWTALCMIRQRQASMEMSDEHLKQISAGIVDRML